MKKITSLLALLGILFFAQNVHAQGGKKYEIFGVYFTAQHYSTYNSSNAVDGSMISKYWSNGTLKNTDYFLVDLGEVKPVGVIKLYFESGDRIPAADVEISQDKSSWTKVGGYTNGENIAIFSCDAKGEKARYVRLKVVTPHAQQWFQLTEFEVYEPEMPIVENGKLYRIKNRYVDLSYQQPQSEGNGAYLSSTWAYAYNFSYDWVTAEDIHCATQSKSDAGCVWTFIGDDTKGWKIMNLNNGMYIKAEELLSNKYVHFTNEESEAALFTFESVTDTYYDIKSTSFGGTKYLNASNVGLQVTTLYDVKGRNWQFIPAEELEVTVSAAGYASIYLPFDVTLPEGLTAYSVKSTNKSYVSLTEQTDIPAKNGAIIAGEGTHTLNIAKATSNWDGNKLLGTNVNTYVQGPAYVLGMKEDGVGLYMAELNKNADGEDGSTHFLNNANKAYLPASAVPQASQVQALFFNVGETTGVEEVEVESTVKSIYDLSGRKVSSMSVPGLYIVNGKKVLVK